MFGSPKKFTCMAASEEDARKTLDKKLASLVNVTKVEITPPGHKKTFEENKKDIDNLFKNMDQAFKGVDKIFEGFEDIFKKVFKD